MRSPVAFAVGLTLLACGREGTPATPWQEHRFVAHALGVPDGSNRTYCDCREGFEASYRRGFRVFEVDVIMATDGVPVAYHGGMPERFGFRREADVLTKTSAILGAVRIDGRFDSLTGIDLLGILESHPDVVLVFDTKFGSYTETPLWFLRHASAGARARIVSYVWRGEQLAALRDAGATSFVVPIHAHRGMNVAKAVSFVRRYGVDTVLGPDAAFTPLAIARLDTGGVRYMFADRGFRRTADPKEDVVLRGRIARSLGVYSDRWIDLSMRWAALARRT